MRLLINLKELRGGGGAASQADVLKSVLVSLGFFFYLVFYLAATTINYPLQISLVQLWSRLLFRPNLLSTHIAHKVFVED